MKVTAEILLQKLPVYTGSVEVVTADQSVNDIIQGVKFCHKKYAADYDLIAEYFIGDTPLDTCKNIFNFIRRSSFYYIEDESRQTLRSPSAILATGRTIGIDCKNYALFIGGILDAINRTGIQYIPFVYRFASDKIFDDLPNHVFIVAFPGTKKEIWIDPIPQVGYFNEKLTYYYFTDKNFTNMSLEILSGRSNQLGAFDPFTLATKVSAIGIDNFTRLFSGGGAPNPNDWMGWPSVGDAKHWTITDGDSVQNEAVNIISWIKAHGTTGFDDNSGGVRAVTVQEIANKLSRAGYTQEAQQLLNSGTLPGAPTGSGGGFFPTGSGGGFFPTGSGSSKTTTYLMIGGAVIAGYFLLKRKKVSGSSNQALLIGGAAIAVYLLTRPKKIDLTNITGQISNH